MLFSFFFFFFSQKSIDYFKIKKTSRGFEGNESEFWTLTSNPPLLGDKDIRPNNVSQCENLLREKVIIRATNNLNFQRNIVVRQVARKMLPVLLGPRGGTRSIHDGGVRRSFVLQTQKNTQA